MAACERCGGELPDGLATCRAYADRLACRWGDQITDAQAADLLLLRAYCAIEYALRHGREEIPEP